MDTPAPLPEGCLRPPDEDALAAALAGATAAGRGVAVYGSGSQRALWPAPAPGVLALSVTGLPARVAVNPANLTARVAAGVPLADLQAALGAHGLWYPPAAGAVGAGTIGGHVATAAAGSRRAEGGVRDWLLGVRALLADGRPVRAGGEMIKNVAGYDLVRLFIGSFGTLGAIVEVALRLAPLPERTLTVAAVLPGMDGACAAAATLLRVADGPAVVEAVPAGAASADAASVGAAAPDAASHDPAEEAPARAAAVAPQGASVRLLARWEGEADGAEEGAAAFLATLPATASPVLLRGGDASAPWLARDAALTERRDRGDLHLEVVVPLPAVSAAWRAAAAALAGSDWWGSAQPTAGVLHLAVPAAAAGGLGALAAAVGEAGGHLRPRTLPAWARRSLALPPRGDARWQVAVKLAFDPAGVLRAPKGLPALTPGPAA